MKIFSNEQLSLTSNYERKTTYYKLLRCFQEKAYMKQLILEKHFLEQNEKKETYFGQPLDRDEQLLIAQ